MIGEEEMIDNTPIFNSFNVDYTNAGVSSTTYINLFLKSYQHQFLYFFIAIAVLTFILFLFILNMQRKDYAISHELNWYLEIMNGLTIIIMMICLFGIFYHQSVSLAPVIVP